MCMSTSLSAVLVQVEEQADGEEGKEEGQRTVDFHSSVRAEDCVGVELGRLDEGSEVVGFLVRGDGPLPPLPKRMSKWRCDSSDEERQLSDRSASSEEEKEEDEDEEGET